MSNSGTFRRPEDQPPEADGEGRGATFRKLRTVWLERRTGVLELVSEAERKRLHFVSGQLYLTTAHPLAKKIATLVSGPGNERGVTSEKLQTLLTRVAETVTAWPAVGHAFTDGLPAATGELIGPLPTARLVIAAAVAGHSENELLEQLGGLDAMLVAAPAESRKLTPSTIGSDAAFLLARFDQPLRLGELLDGLKGARRRWLEVLTGLWAVDLLRPAEAETAAAPAPPGAAAEALLASAQPAEASAGYEGARAIWRDHFMLTGDPFSLTPDPTFLHLSSEHAEALAGLRLGLLERRGLAVLIGEVGTGKTTLLRSLLAASDSSIEAAYVANTALDFDEILTTALRAFGVECADGGLLERLDALEAFLHASLAAGKTPVLVIDEAQNLSLDTCEQLRLLLNLETTETKLMQIVLAGQPELGDRLAEPSLRHLADRIAVRCHLEPLAAGQVRSYVAHRLESAGGSIDLFSAGALALVTRKSRGVPRRINRLCHNAMLFAYGEGQSRVTRAMVRRAAIEIRGFGRIGRRSLQFAWLVWLVAAAAMVAPAWSFIERALRGAPVAEAPTAAAPAPTVPVAPSDAEATPETVEELAEVAVRRGRTTARLVLRTGPGREHAALLTLVPETVVTILGEDGDWLQVHADDGDGWIHRSWVREVVAESR